MGQAGLVEGDVAGDLDAPRRQVQALHQLAGEHLQRLGVGATQDFIREVAALAGVDGSPLLSGSHTRLPWYSRSVDSTYLTGKPVFIYGDATHAIASARIASEELGFEVVGLGSYSRERARYEARLTPLGTIGNNAPFIGLFGTVWGIMRSFTALGSVQHATLAMVAPGIAEALIATAMGLFAAIPAVIAYNRYSDQVDRLIGSYENFAEEFSTILQRQSIAELEERPAEVA